MSLLWLLNRSRDKNDYRKNNENQRPTPNPMHRFEVIIWLPGETGNNAQKTIDNRYHVPMTVLQKTQNLRGNLDQWGQ